MTFPLSTFPVDQISPCVSWHLCACGRVFGTLFVFINNKVIRNCNLPAKRITAVITMATLNHQPIGPSAHHNPTAPFQSHAPKNPIHILIHLAISMWVYLCRLAVFTGCILESPDPRILVPLLLPPPSTLPAQVSLFLL